MFRFVFAVIGVLLGIFTYYAFRSTTAVFSLQRTVKYSSSDVFHFVKNPYMLLDTCYNV